MGRRWIVSLIAAAFCVVAVFVVRDPVHEISGEAYGDRNVSTGETLLVVNEAESESIAFDLGKVPALVGRFSGANVVETRISKNGEREVVESLVDWSHVNGHLALIESHYEQDATSELRLDRQVAYIGDAFLMNADPAFVDEASLTSLLSAHDLYISRTSQVSTYVRVGINMPSIGKLEHFVELFSERFPEAIVEKEPINFISTEPSDWRSDVMWGLDQIDAVDAWNFATGSVDVVVAVIDTGIDTTHEDLVENIWINSLEIAGNGIDDDGNGLVDDVSGWDFVDSDAVPDDSSGHGTHVSGTIGARGNNGLGSVGVNWNVKILPLKVGGATFIDTSAVIDALQYVADLKDRGVNIVVSNNSYGSGSPSAGMREQIVQQGNRGILFVTAAGNDGDDIDGRSPEYPAGFVADNIISVANSNQSDAFSFTSNFGGTSVDLAAPGSGIYSTYNRGRYEFLSGTSMSSPHVAGAVALLASSTPDLNWQQLKQQILDTVDPVPSHEGKTVSGGRLNLLSALRPELKGHFVRVSNVQDAIVILNSEDETIQFQLEALSSASLVAEVVGDSSDGQLIDHGSGLFEYNPTSPGFVRIKFTADLLGVKRSVEKSVFTGVVQDVLSGLLHRYEFEDDSSATEEDLAGNANGTFESTQIVDTDFGQAARFATTTSKMAFNGSHSSRVTIAALVNSENLRSSPHPRIVNMPYYYMYYSTDVGDLAPDGNRDTLKFYVDREESFGVWNSPPNSILEDEWFYVVASYDSADVTNAPSLFINGEKQIVRMQQEPKGGPRVGSASSYIGNNGDATRSFNGLMASVRIYDRELREDEISQLGAVLLKGKWDRYRIQGVAQTKAGTLSKFEVQDLSRVDSAMIADWTIEGAGSYILHESIGEDLRISFLDEGDYRIIARVSDGVSTYVFSKSITSVASRVTAGAFQGSTSGGGIVWMEVEPSLEIGYISILDPLTGYYRFSELVSINQSGAFASMEPSIGKIIGSVAGLLVGEIVGYDVRFSGVKEGVENLIKADYVGGLLGLAGNRLEMQVLEDDRCYIWRKGDFADLAMGSVASDGSFNMLSTRGELIHGVINPTTSNVEGTVGGQAFFLRKTGQLSRSRLHGGAFGGSPSGAGSSGIYGSFVKDGQLPDPSLGNGNYGQSPYVGIGIQVLAFQSEKPPYIDALMDLVDVFHAIENGELNFDDQPLRSIQAQVPVGNQAKPIIGFSILGDEPREVLIRGLGPAFSDGQLENPSVALYKMSDGEFVEITSNDNWSDGALFIGEGESPQGAFVALEEAFEKLSLSSLVFNSQDTAIRVWLSPGIYLARFEKVDGAPGPALVEVYELP